MTTRQIIIFLTTFISLNSFAAGGFSSLRAENASSEIYPRVEKYTYQCADSITSKTGTADWVTEESQYAGTGEDIVLDANNIISTEIDSFGRSVTRIKIEKLESGVVKKTMEMEFYDQTGELADKSVWITATQMINGVETLLSREVNGIPYHIASTKYVVKLSDKVEVYTKVHTEPGLRNSEDKVFSRIFQSCIYALE